MAGFSTKTFEAHDDYMTPKSAWEAVQEYIPRDKIIWEPFYGDGTSGNHLKELGFNVIHQCEDFFENNKGDVVVSNPPFSIKKQVIERLVELDKPFMLIMPVFTLGCNYIRELLGDSIQIIVPRRRIQFNKIQDGKLAPSNKCNFDCFYFCYNMNLPRDVLFLQ